MRDWAVIPTLDTVGKSWDNLGGCGGRLEMLRPVSWFAIYSILGDRRKVEAIKAVYVQILIWVTTQHFYS